MAYETVQGSSVCKVLDEPQGEHLQRHTVLCRRRAWGGVLASNCTQSLCKTQHTNSTIPSMHIWLSMVSPGHQLNQWYMTGMNCFASFHRTGKNPLTGQAGRTHLYKEICLLPQMEPCKASRSFRPCLRPSCCRFFLVTAQ